MFDKLYKFMETGGLNRFAWFLASVSVGIQCLEKALNSDGLLAAVNGIAVFSWIYFAFQVYK
jgi:hypothetical protein